MKALIISDVFGQLGNRLFRFSRLQLTRPAGVVLLDLTLCDYAKFYNPSSRCFRNGFRLLRLLNGSFVARIHNVLTRIAWDHAPRLSKSGSAPPGTTPCRTLYSDISVSRRFLHHVRRHSYYYDCPPRAAADKRRLLDIFRLQNTFVREAERLLFRIPAGSIVVAVHVRRGDYREYAGGKHYFTDDVYLKCIEKLRATHDTGANLAFVLVSDEPLDAAAFDRPGLHYFGPLSIGVDQAILSRSSYILGPASTFSAWPSFLHDIPRAEIRDPDHSVTWSDFGPTSVNYRTSFLEPLPL